MGLDLIIINFPLCPYSWNSLVCNFQFQIIFNNLITGIFFYFIRYGYGELPKKTTSVTKNLEENF